MKYCKDPITIHPNAHPPYIRPSEEYLIAPKILSIYPILMVSILISNFCC